MRDITTVYHLHDLLTWDQLSWDQLSWDQLPWDQFLQEQLFMRSTLINVKSTFHKINSFKSSYKYLSNVVPKVGMSVHCAENLWLTYRKPYYSIPVNTHQYLSTCACTNRSTGQLQLTHQYPVNLWHATQSWFYENWFHSCKNWSHWSWSHGSWSHESWSHVHTPFLHFPLHYMYNEIWTSK